MIPAELRTGIVRIAPSSLRARDIYDRGALEPGAAEQVIPGTPEVRISGTVAVGWIGLSPVGLVNRFVNPFPEPADFLFTTGSTGNRVQLYFDDRATGGAGTVGPPAPPTSIRVPAGATLFCRTMVVGQPGEQYMEFGSNAAWRRQTGDRVIPATPDQIIPSTPDRSLGEVVTIGAAASDAVSGGGFRSVGSGVRAIGFTRLQLQGGRLLGIPVSGSGNTWQQAVERLAWSNSGHGWFGAAEASARAGIWVRRAAWTSETRRIRFEAGAGTTRAVAVTESGARVTTADYGAAEFLADDWEILGDPAAVDITDVIFSGSGAIPFAVVRGSDSDGANPPPASIPEPTTPPFPETGEGFPYVIEGRVARLIPARDLQTQMPWRPS